MRFDCVAGETGEPGEALQSQVGAATSAAKFLFFFSSFFFAGDRLGTAGRWKVAKTEGWRGSGGRDGGLILALTPSPLSSSGFCLVPSSTCVYCIQIRISTL